MPALRAFLFLLWFLLASGWREYRAARDTVFACSGINKLACLFRSRRSAGEPFRFAPTTLPTKRLPLGSLFVGGDGGNRTHVWIRSAIHGCHTFSLLCF